MNFAPVDVGVVEATHLDNVEFVVLPSTFGVAAAHRDVVEKDIAGGMSARRRDGPIQQEARSGVGTPFHHQQCRTPRQHSTPGAAMSGPTVGRASSSLRMSARVNTDVMSAQDNQVIGMTSHAVVEARHGLILCTAWYSTFCKEADGQLLHHHPTAALRSRHRRGGMHIRP